MNSKEKLQRCRSGKLLAHKLFPGINVEYYITKQEAVDEYIEKHKLLNTRINREHQNDLLELLNNLSVKQYKTLAPALKQYDYYLERHSNRTDIPPILRKHTSDV